MSQKLLKIAAGTKRRLQVAGWNFAGWEFCRLGILRLPGILQVDDANLKLHHFKVF
jgi:hypothetical protein